EVHSHARRDQNEYQRLRRPHQSTEEQLSVERSMRVLEMSGISRKFPGVIALDSVNLDASAGEVLALVGENGAGKSTLMKILAGIYQPDSGTIEVAGRPVVIRSPREAAQLGIGIIHQELEVIDSLDVAGNIFLGREPAGGPFRLIDRKQMERGA